MSTSSPTENGTESLPAWMQAIDEDTLYNADPNPDASHEADAPPPEYCQPQATSGMPDASSDSSLSQKLSLSMGASSDLPDLDPNLQPIPAGYVRADLERRLRKAVAVLQTRYTGEVSKHLVLEFALRHMLQDLHEQEEESALVRWLDSALPTAGSY